MVKTPLNPIVRMALDNNSSYSQEILKRINSIKNYRSQIKFYGKDSELTKLISDNLNELEKIKETGFRVISY